MRTLDLFIAVYLGGFLCWLTFAMFDMWGWQTSFFIWQELFRGCLFGWLSLFFCSDVTTKKKVFPLIILSVCKVSWEIIAAIYRLDINNEIAVMVLFLITIPIIGYLSFRPEGFLPKIFIKYLDL